MRSRKRKKPVRDIDDDDDDDEEEWDDQKREDDEVDASSDKGRRVLRSGMLDGPVKSDWKCRECGEVNEWIFSSCTLCNTSRLHARPDKRPSLTPRAAAPVPPSGSRTKPIVPLTRTLE